MPPNSLANCARRRSKSSIGAFLDLVDRQERDGTISNADLAALAANLPGGEAAAVRPWRARALVAALLVALALGFAIAGPVQRWRKSAAITAAFEQGLAEEPGLVPYPLRLEINHARAYVVVRGLAGEKKRADALVAKVQAEAAPYQVAADIQIVSTTAALASNKDEFNERLAEVTKRLSDFSEKLATLAEAVKTAAADAASTQTDDLNALRREMAQHLKAQHDADDAIKSEVEGIRSASDARFAEADARVATIEAGVGLTAQQLKAAATKNLDMLAARIDALREDFAASSERLKSQSASDVQAVSAKLAALETNLATASQRIDYALGDLSSPHRRLLEAAAQSAVFFGDEDNFADPDLVARTLDSLAPVIIASKEGLRVVGHADVTGGPWINARLSHRRAEKVAQMLRDRGVPADQLVVVARGAQESIAVVAAGVAQVNRRVTFEPLLSGERGR